MKRRKQPVDEAVEDLSAAGAEDANGVLSNDLNTNEEARVALRMAKDKEFIRLLNVELDKFNNFFMEKEEE
ncbi:hypothetical protein R1flu_009512 [Riccia fluitans]|uniref:Uncharacterized protein n=1 Tax=Riccia fluitans TaxID=41844 RepID=A0ABD1Z2A4_9MARC